MTSPALPSTICASAVSSTCDLTLKIQVSEKRRTAPATIMVGPIKSRYNLEATSSHAEPAVDERLRGCRQDRLDLFRSRIELRQSRRSAQNPGTQRFHRRCQ